MAAASETEQEIQESEFFQRIVHVFKSYKFLTDSWVDKKAEFVKTFPSDQQQLLASYSKHLQELKVCVAHNADIIRLIISDVENVFENVQHDYDKITRKHPILANDLDKVYTTIRQIARDWSKAGAAERKLCYGPIIDAIEKKCPKNEVNRSLISVLVPGAGLGRLCYELASRGFACQGNEFSLFMLFASNFVLNRCSGVDSLRIYPWVHNTCNVVSPQHPLQAVSFPDVNPSNLPASSQLTMAAGDFLEIYTEANTWDCVVTCFFIDCASNIVNFLQAIFNILKPGGMWVNLGPLLYYYAEQESDQSIEPSYEHVIEMVRKVGFEVTEEKLNVKTTYSQNPDSMMKYEYSSAFFIANKPSKKNSY